MGRVEKQISNNEYLWSAQAMGSVLGEPASRRLGLTMAAEKTKEPNGAAPDKEKASAFVNMSRRDAGAPRGGAHRYSKDKSLYFLPFSVTRMPGRATSKTLSYIW
jgi:hypothetical protein